MIPKNPGIAQKGTQKSGSNPQKIIQNNGTSPVSRHMQVTPPPPESLLHRISNSKEVSLFLKKYLTIHKKYLSL